MKIIKALSTLLLFLFIFSGCQAADSKNENEKTIEIVLGDEVITVDGTNASTNKRSAVYVANDIVYYESEKDFTYGEGSEKDAHDKKEADAHTVLHVTKAGTYRLKGKLSKGQIAVDLGEDAKDDPKAVVNLILDGVDVTCTVAPAVIFYNVYECGDAENASKDVDTSAAGANVILADGSKNAINGSYVERIYKPGSVVLNDDKTEVKDAKKLHKYDGAFYSKASMNISGEKEGTGKLVITAANEGLGTELHLTVNGGNIDIFSGNDGINTNEDGVSVTTINGGTLSIKVTGETGEGDGIDSNGWLVINGGSVVAQACATSGDAGIDSDMGIHINGGTVIASGNMLDRIESGGQTHTVFNFAQKQKDQIVQLKNKDGKSVFEAKPENDYSILIVSSPEITPGVYTLWSGDTQLVGQRGTTMGGGMRPGGMQPPDGRPEGERPFDGQNPFFDDKEWPNGDDPGAKAPPQGETPPKRPEKTPSGDKIQRGERPEGSDSILPTAQPSEEFEIKEGSNTFSGIKAKDQVTNPSDLKSLQTAFTQFFGLPAENGLTVYVWQMAEDSYQCHLTNVVIDALSDQSFIFKAGATVPEMKTILSSYDLKEENVEIKAVVNPLSSYYYEIDDDYVEKIKNLF